MAPAGATIELWLAFCDMSRLLGPPMVRIDTLAASTHRSATERYLGHHLCAMSFSSSRATVGRLSTHGTHEVRVASQNSVCTLVQVQADGRADPALAPNVPSPASVKRMHALGQPRILRRWSPRVKTPASCQLSRIRIGPQPLDATSWVSSAVTSSRTSGVNDVATIGDAGLSVPDRRRRSWAIQEHQEQGPRRAATNHLGNQCSSGLPHKQE